jgi:energy-coupling factor transporter ATP-binding protein EcfA2
MRNFPDLIEAFMEYMQHSDAPKSYQRWAMLSIVASCLERKVWLIRDHDTGWYPNMYLFLIGPAGSGKSTVAEAAVSLLFDLECIDFLSEDLNEVTLFHELRSIGARKKFHFNGQDFPHSAATLFSSEASDTFKEQYKGGSVISKLTSMFNGGPLGWHMKQGVGRSTRMDGAVKVVNPCVNLLACSTPIWLIQRCMTRTDAQGGFGSRILLVVSKDELKAQTDWEPEHKAKDMMLRRMIVEDLKQVNKMQGPYCTSACFKEEWRRCQIEYENWKYERTRAGLLGGYHQRSPCAWLQLAETILS